MDITVQREALLKPLQAISSIVEKKQTLPILSNVLLTLKENQLLLTGTDLEIELIGFVKLNANAASSTLAAITVSARKLFDICRALPESSEIRLTVEKNFLVIRRGDSCFTLNTLPADNFPTIEDVTYPVQFSLPQGVFKSLLSKTYFAMGQQDVRHYLNGTFLDIAGGNIKAVAADGHRMALSSISDDKIANHEARLILPRKSVLELIRLLNGETEDEISLCIADNRFRVITKEYIFTSKLINAQYPDYQRLIPAGSTVAIGDREAIKQALVRASILSNEKFRGVRFQLEPGKLRITANNSDQEQAEEALDLEFDAETLEIGFNVAYLLDIVSVMTDKNIHCAFTGPNEGVLFTSEDGSKYVVMPMRL